MQLVGKGSKTYHKARREGLPTRQLGGKDYVIGKELLDWLESQPSQ